MRTYGRFAMISQYCVLSLLSAGKELKEKPWIAGEKKQKTKEESAA